MQGIAAQPLQKISMVDSDEALDARHVPLAPAPEPTMDLVRAHAEARFVLAPVGSGADDLDARRRQPLVEQGAEVVA